MGLLANTMANPEAAFKVAGVDFYDAQPEQRGTWLSFALVAALHVVGLYAIATWTPRSEWLKLWKPIEVQLLREEAPKPPEIKPIEEPPPPPPKPQVVERKSEPLPVIPQHRVEEKPVVPEQPAPIVTAAPSAPIEVEATFVVPPQPEALPPPPPAPKVQAALPVPKTVSKVEFVRAPDPTYPMMSRRLGEQGKVMVRALIDEQGHALNVAIHQSSGKPRLDEAAKRAVLDALFKPYHEEGKAEQVYVVIPVIFRMES